MNITATKNLTYIKEEAKMGEGKVRTFVFSHGPSEGAKRLAESCGAKRIRRVASRFKPKKGVYVLNWGASAFPVDWKDSDDLIILNRPENVNLAIDKKQAFRVMSTYEEKIFMPEIGRSGAVERWFKEGDLYAFAMINPRGSAGKSYRLVTPDDPKKYRFNTYTRYFKRTMEYRVLASATKTYDVMEKRLRRASVDKANYRIRNVANGWVYCRGLTKIVPEKVMEQAILAVKALGLDFGAVDIAYHAPTKKSCVFEVNTAPGLEGKSVEIYSEMVMELWSKGQK